MVHMKISMYIILMILNICNGGDINMKIDINGNAIESKYCVHTIDPFNNYRMTIIKAKKIVIGDVYTTFYDYYGSISGSFRNDILLGYAKED